MRSSKLQPAFRLTSLLHVAALGILAVPAFPAEPSGFYPTIADLFESHCQECHRPGQVAPMSLMTWEEARPWAKSIAKKVAGREMPPFHAAGPLGRYENDLRLTPAEITRIVEWAGSGALRGDASAWKPGRKWSAAEWRLGEPDFVLELEPYEVRADQKDDNVVLIPDFVFEEDVWIRGVEILPGAVEVVHHNTLFILRADYVLKDSIERQPLGKFDKLLETWLPGYVPSLLPEGEGLLIPAGSRFGLFAHFAPGGRDATDRSRLGFHFADGPIYGLRRYVNMAAAKIRIPAGDARHEMTLKHTIESDSVIHSLRTHMHYRGKSFEAVLHEPGGKSRTIFEIPRYDFNWQREYFFTEPIAVREGSVIEFTGTWDNSAANPANPDPTVDVKGGFGSEDEMWTAVMRYEVEDEDPEPLFYVTNGRRTDKTP